MIARPDDPGRSRVRALPPILVDSIYLGGLVVTLPCLLAAGKGAGVMDHLRRRSAVIPRRPGHRRCVWVHGVSVGEILSARRFIDLFAREYPEWDIVISTTTRTGVEVGRKQYPDCHVVSYPLDLSRFVRRSFDSVRPDLVLIVEHELWPNFLWEAQARGIPVAVVNGRLSERSLRGYRWLSRLVAWPPPGVSFFCVEDEVSYRAFRGLGVPPDRLCVTGNFKFDCAVPFLPDARVRLGSSGTEWLVIGASTHPGEEMILVRAVRALRESGGPTRLVLAPRNIDRAQGVVGLLERAGQGAVRWSRMKQEHRRSPLPAGAVVVVDTVGDLSGLLHAADAVFVGGSLVPFGGHNVVEPALAGGPIVTGPHHGNFRPIVDAFRRREALLVAESEEDLTRCLRRLRDEPDLARKLAQRARETVRGHTGASERALRALGPLIESVASAGPGVRV